MSFLKIGSQSLHGLFNRVLTFTRTELPIIDFRFKSSKAQTRKELLKKNPNPPTEDELLAEKIVQMKKDSKTNAYIRFSQDYVRKHLSLNDKPEYTLSHCIKDAAKKWRSLGHSEKITFLEANIQENLQNFAKLKKLIKELSGEKKLEINQILKRMSKRRIAKLSRYRDLDVRRDTAKPLRPASSWSLFFKEQVHLKGEKQKDFISRVSKEWKNLSDKEKEPYEIATKKHYEEYYQKIRIWEHERILLGKFRLVRKSTINAYSKYLYVKPKPKKEKDPLDV